MTQILDALIFDIEIRRAIPDRDGERLANIEYCEGWRDFPNMGIACIGAFDCREQRPRVFLEDNIEEFFDLATRREWVVGFNSIAFDSSVLEASYPGQFVEVENHYDILAELWKAAGLEPTYQTKKTHGGFGLDATCKANFDLSKTGYGGTAPIDFQLGRYGSLIDYCLNDVHLTRLCLEKILCYGGLLDPRDPTRVLKMEIPA